VGAVGGLQAGKCSLPDGVGNGGASERVELIDRHFLAPGDHPQKRARCIARRNLIRARHDPI
jgi:hypothetical protein